LVRSDGEYSFHPGDTPPPRDYDEQNETGGESYDDEHKEEQQDRGLQQLVESKHDRSPL
jgi:hypothetical protein